MFDVSFVKFVVSQAAGLSSAYIVKSIIANNVSPETKVDVAKTLLGSFAIGGMVSQHVMQNTKERLDHIEEVYNNFVEQKTAEE